MFKIMGFLDSLKKLFGGGGDEAQAPAEGAAEAPTEEAAAEAPAEDSSNENQQA